MHSSVNLFKIMWEVRVSQVKPSNCFRRLEKNSFSLPSIFDTCLSSVIMWILQSYPTTVWMKLCDILWGSKHTLTPPTSGGKDTQPSMIYGLAMQCNTIILRMWQVDRVSIFFPDQKQEHSVILFIYWIPLYDFCFTQLIIMQVNKSFWFNLPVISTIEMYICCFVHKSIATVYWKSCPFQCGNTKRILIEIKSIAI